MVRIGLEITILGFEGKSSIFEKVHDVCTDKMSTVSLYHIHKQYAGVNGLCCIRNYLMKR